jgi:hypothetical protein
MRCLIDADVIRYEVGFCGEWKDDDGEVQIRDFEFVKDILHERVDKIVEAAWSDEPPIMYMTYDRHFHKVFSKEEARQGLPPTEYIPNYRFMAAVTKPYKERGSVKPFHYHNLTAYILSEFNIKIVPGLEADDAICIDQWSQRNEERATIICTRDKDLRMCPGMHYGWECGRQEGFGPRMVTELGSLKMSGNKLRGEGMLFFFAQMITGDVVDSIPGLKGCGPAKAYQLLAECTTIEEAHDAAFNLYKLRMAEDADVYWREQATLLWMVRELTEEGHPIMYDGSALPMRTGRPVLRWHGERV